MLNAFGAYQRYVAIKTHFNQPKYDFYKYNMKIKGLSEQKFVKRNDRRFFYYLSTKYSERELIQFLVVNFLHDPNVWVGNLFSEDAKTLHKERQSRLESLSHTFSNEFSLVLDFVENKEIEFDDIFRPNFRDNTHPPLFRLFLQGMISVETFVILKHIFPFEGIWNRDLDFDPIWKDWNFRMTKYETFFQFDVDKYKTLAKQTYKKRS